MHQHIFPPESAGDADAGQPPGNETAAAQLRPTNEPCSPISTEATIQDLRRYSTDEPHQGGAINRVSLVSVYLPKVLALQQKRTIEEERSRKQPSTLYPVNPMPTCVAADHPFKSFMKKFIVALALVMVAARMMLRWTKDMTLGIYFEPVVVDFEPDAPRLVHQVHRARSPPPRAQSRSPKSYLWSSGAHHPGGHHHQCQRHR